MTVGCHTLGYVVCVGDCGRAVNCVLAMLTAKQIRARLYCMFALFEELLVNSEKETETERDTERGTETDREREPFMRHICNVCLRLKRSEI